MLSDWELWSCANQQIGRHGGNAEFEAALRADALLAVGDLEGQRAWLAILERITQLYGAVLLSLERRRRPSIAIPNMCAGGGRAD